jgi:hypothetical protein
MVIVLLWEIAEVIVTLYIYVHTHIHVTGYNYITRS